MPRLQDGSVLLLIDGLDEIHSDGDRSTFVDNVERFLADFPKIRLVVTSREAGFALVAPSLSRFCSKWRVSALSPQAIRLLCAHWHDLMSSGAGTAAEDAEQLADQITSNPALSRLAENPLLCTMLLVVKHGAGRLPPDRAALYDRAVDVLLDTWNIKGHEALNPNEAVPQLACVAFELLSQGKQTATEGEMLKILEQSREEVQQVKRYARDTPDEFLSRVELRSSLVVEGGRQQEGGKVVPFFQFRHLTFQEYLAAVAAVQGHYFGYQKQHTLLDPLRDRLVSEEWKEVIPMAAVLARKQADPLITALIEKCAEYYLALKQGKEFQGEDAWRQQGKLPTPVASLVTAMAEEADVSPELVDRANDLMLTFARGCRDGNHWQALVRSTYGDELLRRGKMLFALPAWPDGWLGNSVAVLSQLHRSGDAPASGETPQAFPKMASAEDAGEIVDDLLVAIATRFGEDPEEAILSSEAFERAVALIDHVDRSVWSAACWLVALEMPSQSDLIVPSLDRLTTLTLLEEDFPDAARLAGFAFTRASNRTPLEAWKPNLTERQREIAERLALREPSVNDDPYEAMDYEEQAKAVLTILARNAPVHERRDYIERFMAVSQSRDETLSFMDLLGVSHEQIPQGLREALTRDEEDDEVQPED